MTLERWTSGADYDRRMGRWSSLLAGEFLAWLNLSGGLRWIDICCGTGVLTEAICEQASPDSVTGVDLSSEQVDFARRNRSRGNVTFQVANALSLPFPDAAFDVAVSGLGLNFVANPAGALQEIKRVVRPGGTVALYVWDYVQGAKFLREFWDAAIAVDPDATAFDQGRRFPICTESGLATIFTETGLSKATTHALNITTRFSSFEDYWEPFLGGQGSAPHYLATRDPETQTRIRERLRGMLPVDSAGAIELPARAWAIRGRRS